MLHLVEEGVGYSMPHSSVWVYDSVWSKIVELRRQVEGFRANKFWNDAALAYIAGLEDADESLRLEAQIDMLVQRLDRVHREQKSLLRHGSYAVAYAKELRGLDVRRLVMDAPPHNVKMDRPALTEKEIVLIKKMIVFRRAIAEELHEKLNLLMDIRGEGLDPELVDRVRQSLKVTRLPRSERRKPEGVDDLMKLPPGTAKMTPEKAYRMRGRSGDVELDRAFEEVWRENAEIDRERQRRLDAEEEEAKDER